MKFITWLKGAFEDQGGTLSSKRIAGYWSLFLLTTIVNKSLQGFTVNDTVLYVIASFAFLMFGLTIPEWFAAKGKNLEGSVKTPEAKPE